jgi:hypothetical protein
MNTNIRIDRRGLAIAGAVAISYLALGAPLPLAGAALVVTYGLSAVFSRPDEWRPSSDLPALQAGTPEATWVERAAAAAASIEELRRTARSETIAQRCAAIARQARLAVTALHRLAYQAGVVAGMTRSTELAELRSAEQRARSELAASTGPGRAEADRTVASIRARRESAERLDATRRDLGDRIQAGALGLEGVVARVAQIVALTDDTSRSTSIDDLAAELDALRDALVASDAIDDAFTNAITATEREG